MFRKFTTIILLLSLMFFSSNLFAGQEKIKVAFINPGVSTASHATGGFWYNVTSFMEAAAEDLGIELEVLYAERKHVILKKLVEKITKRKNKPDYLVIVNEKNQGSRQLKVAMDAGIKTFMMLNTLVKENDIKKFGQPRGKYPNWIGSLIPDNRYAGYKIGKAIIEKAINNKRLTKDGEVHMVGIAGDLVTPAAVERNEGLKNAVAEHHNVKLKQIINAEWSKDKAQSRTVKIIKRYPQIGAIWAANDPIALGAMAGVVEAKKVPGKDIFIGGLNWDGPALKKIQDKTLTITMGGHFMTGGWVMVLLHDYHNGKDFADEGVALRMKIFDEINSSNVDKYLQVFGDRNWSKIDFTRLSKVQNEKIKEYEFSLTALLKQPDL